MELTIANGYWRRPYVRGMPLRDNFRLADNSLEMRLLQTALHGPAAFLYFADTAAFWKEAAVARIPSA